MEFFPVGQGSSSPTPPSIIELLELNVCVPKAVALVKAARISQRHQCISEALLKHLCKCRLTGLTTLEVFDFIRFSLNPYEANGFDSKENVPPRIERGAKSAKKKVGDLTVFPMRALSNISIFSSP